MTVVDVVSRCRTSRIVDANDVVLVSDLTSYTTQAYKLSLVIDSTVNVHADLCAKDDDNNITRNILDCDQSNYSSRIILCHIPAKLLS